MRILVIEDEKEISDFLKANLESDCFAVDVASDGEKGSFLARTNPYDLIILDYMLPKKNGNEVCKEIREQKNKTPILMLSVKTEVEDKVSLLNGGADDYLAKPFAYSELLARVRALLRRPNTLHDDTLSFDDLELDIPRQSVRRGGHEIYLTRKEFMLLEYLMRNQGIVLSRAMIMEHVWDMNADPFSNTIETHILSLRKKLHTPKRHKIIRTLPGRGYKIEVH